MTFLIALLLTGCAEKPASPPEEVTVPDLPPVEAEPSEATPGAVAPGEPTGEQATGATVPTEAPTATGAAPTASPAAAPAAAPATASAPSAAADATRTDPTPVTVELAPGPPAEKPGPVRYALDPNGSLIYIQVFRDTTTAASDLSHDHVMLATAWTGRVTWADGDPSSCKVEVSVPVSGLKVDVPDMRKKVGYDVMLTDNQRDQVKEHMLDKGQLNGSSFTDMRFESTSCAAAGDKVKVTGKLTLHGVTKTVSPTMSISVKDGVFAAAGVLKLSGSDYGIAPYSAMLGALKNLDEMKLTVNVRGKAE